MLIRALDQGQWEPLDLTGHRDYLFATDSVNKLTVDPTYRSFEQAMQDQSISHQELAEVILDESGYTEMWQNDKTPEAAGRLENLKELVKALDQFENLQGFLI